MMTDRSSPHDLERADRLQWWIEATADHALLHRSSSADQDVPDGLRALTHGGGGRFPAILWHEGFFTFLAGSGHVIHQEQESPAMVSWFEREAARAIYQEQNGAGVDRRGYSQLSSDEKDDLARLVEINVVLGDHGRNKAAAKSSVRMSLALLAALFIGLIILARLS